MIQPLKDKILSYPVCQTSLWCRSGHMQTLLGHLSSKPRLRIQVSEKVIPVEGGDHLRSFYYQGQNSNLVILLHGLAGSTESGYIIRLANQLAEEGHHVLMVNHRGALPSDNQSRQIYHSGRSDDLSALFSWCKREFPLLSQIAVGFSMSANILLLNLGGFKSKHQPDFAIAVNGPICLEAASKKLSQGLNLIYGTHFVQVLSRAKKIKSKWNTTIGQFDENFTAPMGGFQNAKEYYESCSAKKYVEKIKTPTIVLTAEDDPFVSAKDYRNVNWPEQVIVRIEKNGGHLGYLHRSWFRWMDKFISYSIAEAVKSKVF